MLFIQINELIDWDDIEELIDADYSKGKNAVGKLSCSSLLVFRMCLLKSWHGLSDYEVENKFNDSISISYFCGINIDEVVPDHSTLSRFRIALTKPKILRSCSASLMHNWKLTTPLLKRES